MRAFDAITDAIIDAAIQIHRDLGRGVLEAVYEAVLTRALENEACMWNDGWQSASSTTAWCSTKGSNLV